MIQKIEGQFRYWFFRLTFDYPIYNKKTKRLDYELVKVPSFREVFERLSEDHREVVASCSMRFHWLYHSL